MLRRFVLVLSLALLAVGGRAAPAATPQLLEEAVQHWLGERDRWAFTQRAIEYEGDVSHERLERYDPSRPANQRWELIAIDGKPPTPEQREKWAEKKFKRHHRRVDTPIGDFFDFDEAKVVAETPKLVRYEVPLRKDKNWLFPVSKVGVRVTINKETRALEHLTAHVREPFKVLLGIARVTGGDLDLDFLHFDPEDAQPSATKPTGSAHVTVSKMGERVDFTWSDFKRVTPYRGPETKDQTSAHPGSAALPELAQGGE
jgi:hypothetical protein